MKKNAAAKSLFEYQTAVAFALIIAVSVLVYSNTLQAPLVFDDYPNIIDNPSLKIHTLSFKNLQTAATNGPSGHRWLANISFALQFYFNGLDVHYYHLVNLLIHVLTAMTLYFLALTTLRLPVLAGGKTRKDREIALATAVLWAVHPIQTNAVTYIVQRMSSLAALFFLCSLLFYVHGRLQAQSPLKRLSLYGASLFTGFLALVSKENAAMLPIMIPAYDFFFLRSTNGTRDHRKIAAIAAVAVFSILLLGRAWMGGDIIAGILAGYDIRHFSLSERLLTEPRIIFDYLSLLAFPVPSRLNINHHVVISSGLLSPPQTVLAIFGLAGLAVLVPYLYQRHRLVSFGIFWFLGNLLIESSVIALELQYEHRLYLPSTLLFLVVVSRFYRFAATKPYIPRVVMSIIIILFAVFTWQRNAVWGSRVALWSDVVNKSPQLIRGYVNLGRSLEAGGDYFEAEKTLLKAIQQDAARNVDPASPARQREMAEVHDALGIVYRGLNKPQKAIAHSRLALQLNPLSPKALITLGIAYQTTGRHQEAWSMFAQAAASGLDTVDLYNNWGVTCFSLGLVDIAIGYLQHALELAPDHAESHYNLGVAYGGKGMIEAARKEMTLGMELQNRKQ